MMKSYFKPLLIAIPLLFITFTGVGCGASQTNQAKTPYEAANQPATAPVASPVPEASSTPSPELASQTAITYKDGTYQGESLNGINGAVKVEVKVAQGKIAEVTVSEQHETEDIGGKAVKELAVEVVKAKTTEVDDISGATITSKAFKEAIVKALEQAK
ncbi:FMN-binding protein [Desulfitobacterium sp. THU1]|uniref:FMN-binding protein n=1 Tax=Desulfitobacterium sp. THU1 TaxID=3138072 RepID=UPI003120191E